MMMTKNIFRPFYPFAIILMIALQACSVPKPVMQANTQAVPQSFTASTDTASSGAVKWQQFFNDTALQHLINIAINNNLDRQVALQRVIIAGANVRLAKGAMLPTLNGVLAGGAEKYGDYTMNGVGNYDTNLSNNISKEQQIPTAPTTDVFLGLRSNWEIDVWGKLKNRGKAAFAQYLASQKGSEWLTTQLVAAVARAYYQLVAEDNNMEIIKRNIQLQEKALDIVKTQKEGGRANELAVQQFTAQLLHTKGFMFEIQQNIASLENDLNALLGRFPQPVVRSSTSAVYPLPAQLAAGVPSGMLARRADIQEAELELTAAKANTEAARKAFYPSVTITPYIGFNAFNPSLLFSPGSLVYGALGGITAPIFNQNQLKSNFTVANAEQATALYNYQKNVLIAFSEVATSLKAIDNYQQFYKLKQDEEATLSSAVTTANDLYMAGAANYLEVITAQKGVLDAGLEVIMGRRALLLSTIDLYRALGGG